MPAKSFYMMLKEGREIENTKSNLFLHDLCFVSAIPNLTRDSQERIQKMFEERALTDDDREENARVVAAITKFASEGRTSIGTPVLEAGSKEAGAAVLSIFAAKRRAEHGR